MSNEKKNIIAFYGKAGSGKDTAAMYLNTKLDNSIVLSFASALKYSLTLLGWDGEKDKAGRYLLQNLSPVIKEYHNLLVEEGKEEQYFKDDYYAKFLYDLIKKTGTSKYFIISDLRFQEELKLLKLENCITIKVVRDNYSAITDKKQLADKSENDLNDIIPDFTIYNTGSLSELYTEIDNIVNQMKF